MKKIILASLCLCSVTCSLFAEHFSAMNKGHVIYYNILSEGDQTMEVTYRGTSYAAANEYIGDIIVPDSVIRFNKTYRIVKVGEEAFRGCTQIRSITLPTSITSISKSAFEGCSGLSNIVLPEKLDTLPERAFAGCTALRSIKVPQRISIYSKDVFNGCSSLKTIKLSKNVSEIGEGAFDGCGAMTSIIADSLNNDFASEKGVLYNKMKGTLIRFPEGKNIAEIRDSIGIIGERAFWGCSKLTSIIVPKFVSQIKDEAFALCTTITTMDIPVQISYLGEGAFRGCTSLAQVNILGGLTTFHKETFDGCTALTTINMNTIETIGEETFKGCTALTTINLPSSVKSIGDKAFLNCTKLSTIIVNNNKPTSCALSAFDGRITYSAKMLVPAGCVQTYKDAKGWKAIYNIKEQ